MNQQRRNFNRVEYAGRVPQDPDIRYFESGTVIANFAISISQGKDKRTDEWKPSIWIDCRTSKDLAEWVSDNVQKGVRIWVVGKTVREEWQDRTTGEKRGKNYVWVFEAGFDEDGQPSSQNNNDTSYDDIPF